MAFKFEQDERARGINFILSGCILAIVLIATAFLASQHLDVEHIPIFMQKMIFFFCTIPVLSFLAFGAYFYFQNRGKWYIEVNEDHFYWLEPSGNSYNCSFDKIDRFITVDDSFSLSYFLVFHDGYYVPLSINSGVDFMSLEHEFDSRSVTTERYTLLNTDPPFHHILEQQGLVYKAKSVSE